jgi:AbrB family looped-hinge helix DNA binding protein
MNNTELACDAKVMSKGQITIPKNIREVLGVESGDRVMFIMDGDDIKIINSVTYALKKIQKQMKGKAKKAGLFNENDINNWISKSRKSK